MGTPVAVRRADVGASRAIREAQARQLVERLARGEAEALARLYDLYRDAAFGLALRVVRDRALAEDAVQEGFLCVWRNARTFRPELGTPSTWVLTFVHRRAVDIVRRERRQCCDPMSEGVDERESEGDAQGEAWLLQVRRQTQAALAQLAPKQRRALELAYYGGYTQCEIARLEQVPLGTVKSRMSTGLLRLRSLVAETAVSV